MKTILHIEDDQDILEIAKLSLELSGEYSVVQFADPEAGLAAARDVAPDVVLLDLMMPGISGDQVLARLREIDTLAQTPVIFMTARAQRQEVQDLIDKGAQGVIVKPFDPMTLGSQISALASKSD